MSSKQQHTPNQAFSEDLKDDQVNPSHEESQQAASVEQNEAAAEPQSDEQAMKIAQLEAQIKELQPAVRDAQLRAQAEIENIRRRTEQDIEKAHKFALEKFANELLPVIDSLERALEVADKQNPAQTSMIEGIELTLKSLLDAVRKFGVEVVGETHVPFNPDLHQAMSMMESADVAANHVLMVMQRGYTLNGRLLRPAMVAVSKGK